MFMLTEHFSENELCCRCGCGQCQMNYRLLYILEKIRKEYGKPMHITSGYRCRAHNIAVKGTVNSKHMDGMAVDVACDDSKNRYELVSLALILGIKGIGIDRSFIHMDIRSDARMWVY